jgi:hypothetical protein
MPVYPDHHCRLRLVEQAGGAKAVDFVGPGWRRNSEHFEVVRGDAERSVGRA